MNISIEDNFPFMRVMHPAHINYLKKPHHNSLKYFLEVMESLDIWKRHKFLEMTAAWFARSYKNNDEAFAMVTNPEALFAEFKMRLQQAATVFSEYLIVLGMVHYTLANMVNLGDVTTIREQQDRAGQLIDNLQNNPALASSKLDEFVSSTMDRMVNLSAQTEGFYLLYRYFCENVVQRLLEEHE